MPPQAWARCWQMKVGVVLAVVANLWVGSVAFVPVPDPAQDNSGKGSRRGLLGDEGLSAGSAKASSQQAFVPVPTAPPKERALFVAVDDATGEAQQMSGKASRALQEDTSVSGQMVLDFLEQAKTIKEPVAVIRPFYAFPALHMRRLESDELVKMGHDSIVSRMVALAEMGQRQEEESGLEKLKREQPSQAGGTQGPQGSQGKGSSTEGAGHRNEQHHHHHDQQDNTHNHQHSHDDESGSRNHNSNHENHEHHHSQQGDGPQRQGKPPASGSQRDGQTPDLNNQHRTEENRDSQMPDITTQNSAEQSQSTGTADTKMADKLGSRLRGYV